MKGAFLFKISMDAMLFASSELQKEKTTVLMFPFNSPRASKLKIPHNSIVSQFPKEARAQRKPNQI